ncbi:hypothetical protein [Streptomyces sp. NPDC005423]
MIARTAGTVAGVLGPGGAQGAAVTRDELQLVQLVRALVRRRRLVP